jgi:cysteine desulfurase/selenocysteine lyase
MEMVVGSRAGSMMTPFDVLAVRRDFPALGRVIRPGVPLVYLDTAATALKPWPVIRAVQSYDVEFPANVHRGLHTLSEEATAAYESARARVARFLGAGDAAEVIFTRGTTESINLVAQSWGRRVVGRGDEIVVSMLEHHANFVPWQMLAREVGAVLKVADITDDGRLEPEAVARQITGRTRLVALTAMSNVLGSEPPLREIVDLARERGARVLVDAAQSVAHRPLDVSNLGADFVAFSAHKLYGPTGVGVLWARRELLEVMPPVLFGGSMVERVDLDGATWNDVPWKFEAGTPPIAQAIGLGAAIDYLERLGCSAIERHERALTGYAHRVLSGLDGVRLYGPGPDHSGAILGFTVEGVHPHDLAQVLDRSGVAIRAGNHCAQPLHRRLGVAATARASFGLYSTEEEVDRLADAVAGARRLLRRTGPAARGSRTS